MSKETEVVTVSVADHAPVLATPGVSVSTKSTRNTAGTSVKILLGKSISDPDGVRALKGIAITAVDNSQGKWQYSIAANVWVDIVVADPTQALLLSDTAKIRYVPTSGTGSATISYKAWDRTAGQSGDTGVNTTGVLLDLFSTATETATFNVTA